jgi:hypothetical protein
MISEDRNLFGIYIKQQTENNFLSLTDLQTAYEKARIDYGWSDKPITHILQNDSTKERLYYLLFDKGLVKGGIPLFTEDVKKEGITNVLKRMNVYKTTGRGENRETYCDPYIWVLIALELNPMIYAKVIMFITDTLIFDRIEAGDKFLPMNKAINNIIPDPEYYKYAMVINEKVFGRHQTGIRNLASSKELKRISEIEKFIVRIIEQGYVKTESEIIKAISGYS